MTDVHTTEQRRRNMAAIKGKNTKPELVVRSTLNALGYRFRLHRDDLPGKPDILLPKYETAIFVHGCFWHSHQCRYGRVAPATRSEFWTAKRTATKLRDKLKARELRRLGWKVWTIWECQTKDEGLLERKIGLILPRK